MKRRTAKRPTDVCESFRVHGNLLIHAQVAADGVPVIRICLRRDFRRIARAIDGCRRPTFSARQIQRRTGRPAESVAATLALLLRHGGVKVRPGGKYAVRLPFFREAWKDAFAAVEARTP